MDETTKLFDSFQHRLNLTDKLSKDVNNQENNNNLNITRQKDSFQKEISDLKEQFDELSKSTNELVVFVYQLGKILKDKVTTRDLDKIKEKIDSWNFEEFVRHDELEQTFSQYHDKN
jgi:peptidoglycan hydrolase CwlO-like protein